MAKKDEPEERSRSAPKKSGKLMKIIIAVAVLAGAGGGAAWYMTKKPAEEQVEVAVKEKPATFLVLDPFTVNLQSEGEDQYLQVGISLKVTAPIAEDAIRLHTPEIRNRILLLLSDKKTSEISGSAGKRQLSTEILDATKQSIASEKAQQEIIDVLFTSFVIQ